MLLTGWKGYIATPEDGNRYIRPFGKFGLTIPDPAYGDRLSGEATVEEVDLFSDTSRLL